MLCVHSELLEGIRNENCNWVQDNKRGEDVSQLVTVGWFNQLLLTMFWL